MSRRHNAPNFSSIAVRWIHKVSTVIGRVQDLKKLFVTNFNPGLIGHEL